MLVYRIVLQFFMFVIAVSMIGVILISPSKSLVQDASPTSRNNIQSRTIIACMCLLIFMTVLMTRMEHFASLVVDNNIVTSISTTDEYETSLYDTQYTNDSYVCSTGCCP